MDAHQEYVEALAAGDPDTIADATERLGMRRDHDPIAWWPSEKLDQLIEARPDLLVELQRRRPGEVQQA